MLFAASGNKKLLPVYKIKESEGRFPYSRGISSECKYQQVHELQMSWECSAWLQPWDREGAVLFSGHTVLGVFFVFLFFCFCFLGLHLWHMEVPRLGVKSELQLPAYTTVHGNARSLTHWASEARDRTQILMDTRICFCCATTGTPLF